MFLQSIVKRQEEQASKMLALKLGDIAYVSEIIRKAKVSKVLPPARAGNTHEDGAKTAALLIPFELRERLEALRESYGMKNFKRTIMLAIYVGVSIMEHVEYVDHGEPH